MPLNLGFEAILGENYRSMESITQKISWSGQEEYDPSAISKFEDQHDIVLSVDYKTVLSRANGATPDRKKYDVSGHTFTLGSFLSWNPRSSRSVLKAFNSIPARYRTDNPMLVPFAVDSSGDLLCFDFSNWSGREHKHSSSRVALYSKKNEDVLSVSTSFARWYSGLH